MRQDAKMLLEDEFIKILDEKDILNQIIRSGAGIIEFWSNL
jgi:hypothetical protein